MIKASLETKIGTELAGSLGSLRGVLARLKEAAKEVEASIEAAERSASGRFQFSLDSGWLEVARVELYLSDRINSQAQRIGRLEGLKTSINVVKRND